MSIESRMKNIHVSVIVPIYNASSDGRLAQLLQCLKNQNLRGIEFILIFDCPTDDSYEVAKQVVGIDERFLFIQNETNLHIGYTRNIGLSRASGEYIAFADDDDKMAPDMYANLYSLAKREDADIVVSPAIFDNCGEKSVELFEENVIDLQQYFIDRLVGEISEREKKSKPYPYLWGNGNMWNKIFRRSIIKEQNIQFVDTRRCTFEDILFQLEVFCLSRKIVSDMTPYYTHIYYKNRSNTSRSKEYTSISNKCNFLLKLIELHHSYPQMIAIGRVEKKVLDTLIDIVEKQKMNDKNSRGLNTIMSVSQLRYLNFFIHWFPSFIFRESVKIQIFYLLRVWSIKFSLR